MTPSMTLNIRHPHDLLWHLREEGVLGMKENGPARNPTTVYQCIQVLARHGQVLE